MKTMNKFAFDKEYPLDTKYEEIERRIQKLERSIQVFKDLKKGILSTKVGQN
jgi:hypothetical protein